MVSYHILVSKKLFGQMYIHSQWHCLTTWLDDGPTPQPYLSKFGLPEQNTVEATTNSDRSVTPANNICFTNNIRHM
jgi:hypothetical protein